MENKIDKTKDYSDFFECIKELPESGYCFLPDDLFTTTSQNVIQKHLFSLGYGWERIVTPKNEPKIWNHAYSIYWRIVEKGGTHIKDLSWSYDESIDFSANEDVKLEKVEYDDYFRPKETYKGFISGLTFGI